MTAVNDKKREQLGMAWGTANGRLQRRILFHMVQKAQEDTCFHCGLKIDTIEEFSVGHKTPWLDQDPELFWDMDNIAFSHYKCNIAAARRPNKIDWPEGKAWCWSCQTMKDLDKFPACKVRIRTQSCTSCNDKQRLAWRKRNNKR